MNWVARINPRDPWHQTFRGVSGIKLVARDEVLDEVLAHLSGYGPEMRSRSTAIVRQILTHPDIEVVPQSRQSRTATEGGCVGAPGPRGKPTPTKCCLHGCMMINLEEDRPILPAAAP